ncbi:MAG: hypothetical protein AAGA08_07975 [Pseudomonadota bacterium]
MSILPVNAQDKAIIDRELADQLDFRTNSFASCFGVPVCEIDGVTVQAFTKPATDKDWEEGLIYWDPVDGLGVMQGGQDDEIDFNERLLITLDDPQEIDRIWLSDLFIGEGARVEPRVTDEETAEEQDFNKEIEVVETAAIEISLAQDLKRELRVTGDRWLPNTEFNEIVDESKAQTGEDMNFRLVVSGDELQLLFVSRTLSGERELDRIKIGEIDPEKRELFDDQEELVYDLSEIFEPGEVVRLVSILQNNGRRILSVFEDKDSVLLFDEYRDGAEAGRQFADITNGEVSVILNEPVESDGVLFYPTTGSSNDFSVAGIVFRVE